MIFTMYHLATGNFSLKESLFLTGYGLSVSVKNTRLLFKQGINDPFENKNADIVELHASACPFDKVILQGKGYISTEALQILGCCRITLLFNYLSY